MIEENEELYSLEIEIDDEVIDETGIEVISFVEDPAVQIDFHYFSEEKEEFETYNDYPKGAKSNACRALEWAEENGWGSCGEATGKRRASQLCNGENISRETISRMASFKRHQQHKDVPYSEGCGGLMWDAWGGTAGIEWAQRKLEEIDEELSYDSPIDEENVKLYVDSVLSLASSDEYGIQLTPDDVILNLNKTSFGAVSDIIQAIRGLDILKRFSIKQDEEAKVYWKYTGRSAQRTFCKGMLALSKAGKIFTREEIEKMSRKSWQPRMGPRGSATYDLFRFCGGVSCVHYWSKMLVFKSDSGKKVVIEGNPENFDEEQAMSSQNKNYPSPYGYISNNARVQLSNFQFAVDDDERVVVGVVMLPGKQIKRIDEEGNTFSIIFTEDTIRKMSEKFFKDSVHNNTDQNHDFNISTQNTLLESWIVEDVEFDKSRLYGFDVPVGTWLVKYKINDDKLWSDIKRGVLKGFSLAGSFIKKLIRKKKEEVQFQQIVNILKNVEIPD